MEKGHDPQSFLKKESSLGNSELRSLLRPVEADNDAASDEEDVAQGTNYMFRSLLDSVAEQRAKVVFRGNKENR